jgi:hypothetical protein
MKAAITLRNRKDPGLAAGVSRAMAYLDRCGATFEAVPGYPTWFAARWEDPESFDKPRRWACCTEEWDREFPYALAFKARVERGARS